MSVKRVEVPEGVLVRELQGESVLLNLDSESYFGLDDVGTRMWSALTTAGSVEAAFETLLGEYEVEPGQLRADLSAFVETLAGAGLVRVVPG
jgi:hypothetical protein